MNLKVKKFVVGPLEVNTYLVIAQSKCLIIDPADDFEVINNYIQEQKLDVVGLLITHAHFDHIRALNKFYNAYKVNIYVHQKEVEFIKDPSKNLSVFFSERINHDVPITPITSNNLKIDCFEFETILAPGHSPGSILYYFKNENIMFTGDVLFKDGIGRYDFPTSSYNDLMNSLKIFKTLPKSTIIYPGHGDKTNIKNELENNIYMRK